jgi:hypothetical protein
MASKNPAPVPQHIQEAVAQQNELIRKARLARAVLARTDPAIFAMHVMRDEESGAEINLAPFHHEWHKLLDEHRLAILWSFPESGKTNAVSIARVLYKLGKNPAHRILVISKNYSTAVKIVRSVRRYIESSEALREVADDVTFHRLERGSPWTDGAFTVKRREGQGDPKEPSVQAVGINGGFLGARLDSVIGDDMLDFESTYTKAARDKSWEWFNSMVINRLSRQGTIAMIGNVWHPDDLMHRLVERAGWFGKKYPIINELGESLWPERWTLERIEEHRQRLIATPDIWARQYLLNPVGDAEAEIKVEDFDEAMRLGNGITPIKELEGLLPEGFHSYTAVDIGSGRMTSASRSAIFSILINQMGQKLILECQSGKWKGGELADRVIDAHRRYQSLVVVEHNGVQDQISDLIGDRFPGMMIRAFQTGMNRYHSAFGIGTFGVELARGLWIIPNMGGRMAREIAEWRAELLSYRAEDHPGDRLIASWIAREAARVDMRRRQPAKVSVRLFGGPPQLPQPTEAAAPEPIFISHRW